MLALRLPACPEQLPTSFLRTIDPAPMPEGVPFIASVAHALQAVIDKEQPQMILGSDATPVQWWLLAASQLPQAQRWLYSGQRWTRLDPAEQVPQPPQAPPAPAAAPAPAAVAAPPAAPRAPKPLTDAQLQSETFKLAAWGPSPERLRQLDDLAEQALQPGRPASLHGQLQAVRRNGEKAYELGLELDALFRSQGAQAAQAWLDKKSRVVPHERMATHLRITLDKLIKRQHELAQRQSAAQAQQYKSNVAVQMHDGQHPNSLHQQAPATHWRIFIDETGSVFDEQASALNPTDKDVGRIVALAVPASTKLPELKDFHAADASPAQVDKVLQTLLDAQVGILGFSVQDSMARHSYWLGQVMHLIRWTLLQLPVPENAPSCQVQIYIEQRDGYSSADSLRILARTLESEFRALDPERFCHLGLKLEFMEKSHPMNGYVDAVAFTWGSPAGISKDRLKKSQLRGHCLIDAAQQSLHHLFLSLSEHTPLDPRDWYALCSAASSDREGGFLHRSLARIGAQAQQTRQLWQRYLGEVQQRLAHKQYRLSELGHALAWLKRHAPAGQTLPEGPQLLLLTNELALHNHLGRADPDLLLQCLELAMHLRDEDPALATETLLRIATASTNHFEFTAVKKDIENWLQQPVAVPGLLLYGKLQSTLGQIAAFTGHSEQALQQFDAALASFARLSDPEQAQREQAQTRSYRLAAQMDACLQQSWPQAQTQALLQALQQGLGDKEPQSLSRSLAHSGQDQRFAHYLWLRALVHLPQQLDAARQAYVQLQHQWQDGTDHPWPLINAYRAWLLSDAGHTTLAQEYMLQAIDACMDASHGPTLQWMAEVLRTLAQALGLALPVTAQPSAGQRQHLHALLPHAPHTALAAFVQAGGNMAPQQLLLHLAACLPFNFH